MTTTPCPRAGLQLPAGAGKVVFQVRAVSTQQVQFFLSPTGTDTAARLLVRTPTAATDGPRSGATPTNLGRHLTVQAIGSGEANPDTVLGLYHPDPHQLTPPPQRIAHQRRM